MALPPHLDFGVPMTPTYETPDGRKIDLNEGLVPYADGSEGMIASANPLRAAAQVADWRSRGDYMASMMADSLEDQLFRFELAREYTPQPISDPPGMSQSFKEEQEIGGGGGTLDAASRRLGALRARENLEDAAGLPPAPVDMNES